MNVRTTLLAIVCTIMPLAAYAQGRPAVPGPPAGAGQTIQSLSEALTALTARVTALESGQTALENRASKLESGQVEESDLIGTYAQVYLGIELLGNPGRISTETISATFTLENDHDVIFSGTADDCLLQQGTPWAVTCAPQEGGSQIFAGTWSFQNGMLAITFVDGDHVEAIVGAGGRVVVFGGMAKIEYAPNQLLSFSNIGIFVKLPSQ